MKNKIINIVLIITIVFVNPAFAQYNSNAYNQDSLDAKVLEDYNNTNQLSRQRPRST